MLTLTALFWGGNTIAGRLAVGDVSPMMVVFLRWLIVAAILVPLCWKRIRSEWPIMRPYLPRIILMAAFGFVGFNSLFYIAATQTTPSGVAVRGEAIDVLEAAISTLSEQDQEVIAMRHFENLSNKQVSEVLAISTTAASNRYVRALERLRDVLEQAGVGLPQ